MKVKHLLVPITLIGLSLGLSAQEVSPVQSAARPYKLDIVDKVQVAGSDEASKIFQTEVLPGVLKLTESAFSESKEFMTVAELEAAKKAAEVAAASPEAREKAAYAEKLAASGRAEAIPEEQAKEVSLLKESASVDISAEQAKLETLKKQASRSKAILNPIRALRPSTSIHLC